MTASVAPYPHQYVIINLLILVILVNEEWYLIVVLVCISLMANGF